MVDLFELLIGKEGEKDYKKKPVIVQGITGKFGSFYTQQMLAYGTNIVAGVTPGKGGQKLEGVPIYETMRDAVNAGGAQISIVFFPAKFFFRAANGTPEAGIQIFNCIPEHRSSKNALTIVDFAKKQ